MELSLGLSKLGRFSLRDLWMKDEVTSGEFPVISYLRFNGTLNFNRCPFGMGWNDVQVVLK